MKPKQRMTFEFLSIVLAVVLAMGLTEWRQNALNKRQAEVSFQNIIKEIEDNYEELLGDSAKMSQNLVEMTIWVSTDKEFRDTLDLSVNFDLSFLNASAWEVAKFNQSLTFLENEKVQRLAQVYLVQEFFERAGNKVFSQMSDLVRLTNENSLRYEEEMRAFRFEMRLAFSAALAYITTAREVLKTYPIPSDSAIQ
jgi:hypothetical protein